MNEARQKYITQLKLRYPNSPKMVDYCDKRAYVVVELDDGEILPIAKAQIKKDFCFGESGYDYQEKIEMAERARKSVDYFVERNLEEVRKTILYLRDPETKVLVGKAYDGESQIAHMCITTWGNLMNYPWMYRGMREASDGERLKLINAYGFVKYDLETRVKAYLKRYGLSKVRAWTFWLDA